MRHPGRKTPGTDRVLAKNRRARRDYRILETYEAGLVLSGTEVKAARAGEIQLKDSYVEFRDGQAYLAKTHISPYSHGNRQNHEPERVRKLLLQRREIDRLYGRTQLRGLTVVPLEVRIAKGWIKVEIALVEGRRAPDKREVERARELDREAAEAMRGGRFQVS